MKTNCLSLNEGVMSVLISGSLCTVPLFRGVVQRNGCGQRLQIPVNSGHVQLLL